jgi:hypothetical protein
MIDIAVKKDNERVAVAVEIGRAVRARSEGGHQELAVGLRCN